MYENLWTSSRYFSKLKDLSLDALAMYAECLRKYHPNKLYLPKQMENDQLATWNQMNQLHWGSWMESLGTSPKQNEGYDGRPWSVAN